MSRKTVVYSDRNPRWRIMRSRAAVCRQLACNAVTLADNLGRRAPLLSVEFGQAQALVCRQSRLCLQVVTVSRAMQDLVGITDHALEGSYIEATLLDPHPANGSTIFLASINPLVYSNPVTLSLFVYYEALATREDDPQVVIPRNVKQVEVIYQHSSFTDFVYLSQGLHLNSTLIIAYEFIVNLWGEGPDDGIVNQSTATISWIDLSNKTIPNTTTPIGHSEVTEWYQWTVVDAGTAYSIGAGGGGAAPALVHRGPSGQMAPAVLSLGPYRAAG